MRPRQTEQLKNLEQQLKLLQEAEHQKEVKEFKLIDEEAEKRILIQNSGEILASVRVKTSMMTKNRVLKIKTIL